MVSASRRPCQVPVCQFPSQSHSRLPHPHLQPHRPTTTLPWYVVGAFVCVTICMRPGTLVAPSSRPPRSPAQAANPFTVAPERPSSMTSQASGASGVNIQTGARARKMSDGGRKPSSTVMCGEFDGLSCDTCFPTCRPPRHRWFPEGPGHGHPPRKWLLQRGVRSSPGASNIASGLCEAAHQAKPSARSQTLQETRSAPQPLSRGADDAQPSPDLLGWGHNQVACRLRRGAPGRIIAVRCQDHFHHLSCASASPLAILLRYPHFYTGTWKKKSFVGLRMQNHLRR